MRWHRRFLAAVSGFRPVTLRPERDWRLEAGGEGVVCRAPGQAETAILFNDLARIVVETNDSGPWGMDVWWLLLDDDGVCRVMFPLGATGEAEVLDRFSRLPGFKIDGMNSGANAIFLCWQRARGANG